MSEEWSGEECIEGQKVSKWSGVAVLVIPPVSRFVLLAFFWLGVFAGMLCSAPSVTFWSRVYSLCVYGKRKEGLQLLVRVSVRVCMHVHERVSVFRFMHGGSPLQIGCLFVLLQFLPA
jgi:hypothetical protein